MANLESSWEASVVKLAQTGNLRAITFWLNRYLVPQGLCAQVALVSPGEWPDRPAGGLTIRIVCHRLPDCDRLVHFLRQRFLELNSEIIHDLHITAQRVGSPELLWERSVALRFAVQPQPSQPQSSQPQPSQPQALVRQPASVLAASVGAEPAQRSTARIPIQFIPRPIPRNQPAPRSSAHQGQPIGKKRLKKPMKRKVSSSGQVVSSAHRGKAQGRRYNWKTKVLYPAVDHVLDCADDLKAVTARTVYRSQYWLKRQSPEVRSLLIGGSVASIVAVGCGLQVLSQYVGAPSGDLWQATLRQATPADHKQIDQSGTVQAALERIPVIRQAVQNPQDPSVTLVFAENAALGQGSGIAAYQQADLLMSNLENPIAAPVSVSTNSSPTAASSTDSTAPDSTASLGVATKAMATKAIALASAEPSATLDTVNDVPSEAAAQESIAALGSAAGYMSAEAEVVAETEAAEFLPSTTLTLEDLQQHGVDLVNLATDRLMASETDLPQTLNLLSQQSIYAVGAGQSQQEARRPQVFDIKGQKIAILGYSDSELHTATNQKGGLNPSLNSQIEADIKALRDQVDWVIVSYHWSQADQADPAEAQITLSQAAIDHGADLVVGYAPQVMQGAEIYGGRAIVYSLGNHIGSRIDQTTYNTAALKVTLQDRRMQVEYLPIQVQQNQSTIAEGESLDQITRYLQQASSLFDHPLRSPLTLNARLRVSLPIAPDAEMPTDPFLDAPKDHELNQTR
ncbi:MAG: CapA family protein [Oscillatoriophycideae cyanobacterium NC_groundwater_1537_Pr4_S-0.65um_50_18]|nr:CapA family protein [Oscillatoriophycideae cyanobacterium NC_groundwater_1537_Pr4_S-0.65um_50_18]